MRMYKYFDIIKRGSLFTGIDGEGESGTDAMASHMNRDRVMISRMRTLGEVLKHGLADPRKIGEDLIEMADEAEAIEKEVVFGWE
jgi:hypothetical protein